jgi:hypothetical protein
MADLTPGQFSVAVLRRLGIQPTAGAVQAMIGWQKAEGGHWHNSARYNPLNTTQPAPGAGNTGTQGNIKVYRSWDQGIDATVQTLKNGHYGAILNALKTGHAGAVAGAIGQTPWGTSGDLVRRTIMSTAAPGSIPSAPAAHSGGNTGGRDSSGGTRTITTTTPGVDNRAERAQLVLSFLNQRNADPVTFALQARALGDVAPTSSTQTQNIPGSGGARTTAGHEHTGGNASVSQSGVADFEGKKVAAWIRPALVYARQHGWKGTINSGYRSFADQTRIWNSGVRPAARPGTSNHEGAEFPRGAVDVSDAQTLSNILLRSPWARKLIYAGTKDPVHFSHPHNGSY